MRTGIRLWRYASQNGLKPITKMPVSEWADKYRVLSAGISAEPGKWKTSRAPYQKEIMDAFTQPGIHKVVAKTCSQVGKSDIMNNVIGRFAHLDPCTVLMVQPTIEMAEDFSKSRIAPMIRDTKVLNRLFFDAKSRSGNNTILSKLFPGGRLVMCGANAPSALASRPVRILLADEVDRFPISAGTEGDPISLAAPRMTTFWNNVMGLFSTPTTEGASRIETEYLAGTQEEWRHECPNCKEFHVLRHTQMHTEHEERRDRDGNVTFIVRSVKWRCPDCGFEFSERQMKDAPQRYIPQNPAALENGTRSFFINAFSSPWLSWAGVMKEWLEARGDPQREQVIVNTRFGETYRMIGAYDDETQFLKRREDYGAELPHGVLLLTAAVDVQSNRLEYEICGWGFQEECWGILRGIVPGDPSQDKTWGLLDNILDKFYTFSDGRGLKVGRVFVDSGYLSGKVYEYCRKNLYKQRIPIKGVGGMGNALLIQPPTLVKGHGNLPLQRIGVNEGKQLVLTRLGLENPGQQYFHFPLDDKALGSRGYDQIYFKGIIAEQRKIYKQAGIIKVVWEPISKTVRNEPLDLRVYNLACVRSLGDRWAERQARQLGIMPPESEQTKQPAAGIRKSRPSSVTAMKNVNIW